MEKLFSERIGIASLFLLALFSVVGWYAFFSDTLSSYLEGAQAILLGFSFASIFFFLGSLIWEDPRERVFGALLPFAPLLIFQHTPGVIVAVLIASASAYFAIRLIQTEKEERIRFQYFKTVQAGQFFFILGLSLAIATSQYVTLSKASWEEIVPRFRLGEGSASLILKAASYWQPELQTLQADRTTVDEYLLGLAEARAADETDAPPLPPDQDRRRSFSVELNLVPGVERELAEEGSSFSDVLASPEVRERYLAAGRSTLAELSRQPVSGDDPIVLVFSAVLQRQIINAASGTGNVNELSGSALPLALSVLLFLALLPLGALLSYVWHFFGYAALVYLLRTRQVEIVTHTERVEELEVADN